MSSVTSSSRTEKRRRNKRRHAASSSNKTNANNSASQPTTTVRSQDPFQVISLAVRYDESMNDEEVLKVPLESGSLYNHALFAAALEYLQKKTTPPPSVMTISHTTNKNNLRSSSQQQLQQQKRKQALTPIILSGLLSKTTASASGGGGGGTSPATSSTTTTELVQYTQQMRRAAMARIKMRQERKRIQRLATPILVVGITIALYLYTLRNLQHILDEYGFVDQCEEEQEQLHTFGYNQACRVAEAYTWEKLNQAQPFQMENEFCTVGDCSSLTEDEKMVPLYTMHTLLDHQELSVIPLDAVVGHRRGGGRRQSQKPKRKRRKPIRLPEAQDFEEVESPVQWLGDSVINMLVREALVAANSGIRWTDPFALLDVGSGLSGLLFSLLTPEFPFRHWTYHGISISQPEVQRARQLLRLHQVEVSRGGDSVAGTSIPSLRNATVERANFDEQLPPKSYSGIVAIESLSYSRNLTRTLDNLAAALKPKGTLVVVDNVVAPWLVNNNHGEDLEMLRNRTAKISLVTHQEWLDSFATAGLVLQSSPRDLTLEFDWSSPLQDSDRSYDLLHDLLEKFEKWNGRGNENLNYGTAASFFFSSPTFFGTLLEIRCVRLHTKGTLH